MSTLKNARWEKFAQAVVDGVPQSRAYIAAGYKARGNAAEVEASKLVRNPKVSARIDKIKEAAAAKSEMTRDAFVADCWRIWRGEDPSFDSKDRVQVGRLAADICGFKDAKEDPNLEVHVHLGNG